MMDDSSSKQIEVILRSGLNPEVTVDRFFDSSDEALLFIAEALFSGDSIIFISLPCVKCFDFDREDIYFT